MRAEMRRVCLVPQCARLHQYYLYRVQFPRLRKSQNDSLKSDRIENDSRENSLYRFPAYPGILLNVLQRQHPLLMWEIVRCSSAVWPSVLLTSRMRSEKEMCSVW